MAGRAMRPPGGKTGPSMPPFADSLADAQVVQLTECLRARFSRGRPWKDIPGAIRTARKATA
jgi:hypothetical protein